MAAILFGLNVVVQQFYAVSNRAPIQYQDVILPV